MLLLLLKDLVELFVQRRAFLADSGFLHGSVESDVHSDVYLHVHNQHTHTHTHTHTHFCFFV